MIITAQTPLEGTLLKFDNIQRYPRASNTGSIEKERAWFSFLTEKVPVFGPFVCPGNSGEGDLY